MNTERDFKGVWIPKEVYLNKDLSWSEKILLIEIDSLDNDDEKGCFASNKYLAEFIGVSESSMANMISKLKSQNYLFQVFFDGRNRGLRLHKNMKAEFINSVEVSQKYESRVHKNMKSDLIKIVKQTTQKNEHNNTINNTVNNTSSINVVELKNSTYKSLVDVYFSFYKSRTKVDPSFSGMEGKAIKKIETWLIKNANGKEVETFEHVFKNWDKVNRFHKEQIDIRQIASNWNTIISDLTKEFNQPQIKLYR